MKDIYQHIIPPHREFDALSDLVATGTPGPANTTVLVKDVMQAYRVAAPDATDHDLTTEAGIKLYVLGEVYDPRSFGWKQGEDIAPYISAFATDTRTTFRLPPGSEFTLGSEVTLLVDQFVRSKRLELYGTICTQTSSNARIVIAQNSKTAGVLKYLEVCGGDTYLHGDNSVGWHVRDARNIRFYGVRVWGNPTRSFSRGTGWFMENHSAYCERSVFIDCGAPYCKHDLHWHMSGGEDGGLSFARQTIINWHVNGGVAGEAKFKLSTGVETSLGVTNASAFEIGETVVQTSTGASGVVLGWPEARDVLLLGSVVGEFDTASSIVGETTGEIRTPSTSIENRLPNIYDSEIRGIRGNVNGGVIIMELGGAMIGTRISNLGVETSPSVTSYYFHDLGNWTYDQPQIDPPEENLGMKLFYGERAHKSSGAAPVLDGLHLIPSDVAPDAKEGVLAVADGSGWNPANVGNISGGKGLFARLWNGWRRVLMFEQSNDILLADAGAEVNTTGKYYGKLVLSSTSSNYYLALGPSASSPWKAMYDGTGASNIVPV